MTIERTFSIIKPDAVAKNIIGEVYHRFECAGLHIIAAGMLHLSQELAAGFYAEHKGKPFYDNLLKFMTSGPIVVQVLEGQDAIRRHRELLGATDPEKAQAGTIRADHAISVTQNAVHGSDSAESAAREIAFFFTEDEICPRTR